MLQVRPVAATVTPGVVPAQTAGASQTPVGQVGGQQVVQSNQPPPPSPVKITDEDIKQVL